MVRTRADAGGSSAGRKVVAARAPRKVLGAPSTSGSNSPSNSKASKYAGGNPVCPRPTPEWQKGIGSFFQSPNKGKENSEPIPLADEEESEPGCSSSSQNSEMEAGPSCSSDND